VRALNSPSDPCETVSEPLCSVSNLRLGLARCIEKPEVRGTIRIRVANPGPRNDVGVEVWDVVPEGQVVHLGRREAGLDRPSDLGDFTPVGGCLIAGRLRGFGDVLALPYRHDVARDKASLPSESVDGFTGEDSDAPLVLV
jgi:hypothetical protein